MLEIGSKVRVRENAFLRSDDPKDFLARGKIGWIVYSFGDGAWEVQTEDDDFLPLTTEELEELDTPPPPPRPNRDAV